MLKTLLILFVALFFIGCESNESKKVDFIELNTSLGFEGTVFPVILPLFYQKQAYVLTNKYYSERYSDDGLTLTFMDKNKTDNLFYSGYFYIEQKNGKTCLYPNAEMKYDFDKKSAEAIAVKIIFDIKKSKEFQEFKQKEKNLNSWK